MNRQGSGRIGLALAGGGPLGGMYEIGAVMALQDAIEGLDMAALDCYVGVSAGAIIGACLANGMSPNTLNELLVNDEHELGLNSATFFKPAWGEFARSAVLLPALSVREVRRCMFGKRRRSWGEAAGSISQALPVGLFDNAPVDRYLRRVFAVEGRSNDFRDLGGKLFVVAADINSGEAVAFGKPGWQDVPVSRAVQASTALPGLYRPVTIRERQFVDGALRKTLHASVALEQGVDLLFCVNPLIAFDAVADGRGINLVHGGMPMVLEQTFRALIHSRMEVGMAKYRSDFPDSTVVLFEPHRSDSHMFFENVFSFANRRDVVAHAYRATMADIAGRGEAFAEGLARHGLTIREEVVQAASHAGEQPRQGSPADRLEQTLDQLGDWLSRRADTAK